MLRILILISIVVGFSSCSMISIGYDFGDWLIKKRVLQYVKFYSPQQEKLEAILDDFMAWHKANALPRYSADIAKIQARFKSAAKKPLSSEELGAYLSLFRSRYLGSFSYLNKKMTPLLSELNGEQIDRTKVLLGRKLDELKDRSKVNEKELLKQLEGKWVENLEEWFGTLSKDQLSLIKKRVKDSFISPKIVWAKRGKRTTNFIDVFDEKSKEKRIQNLSAFFLNWENDDFYSSWRSDVAIILEAFLKTLTSSQREHLQKKLNETQAIVKSLQD